MLKVSRYGRLCAGAALAISPAALAQQISPNPNPSGDTITIGSGDMATNTTFFDNFGDLINNGQIANSGNINNQGLVVNSSTGSFFNLAGSNYLNGGITSNNGTYSNDGIMTNQAGGLVDNFASFTNSSTFRNNAGGTVNNTGSLVNTGSFTNNGTMNGVFSNNGTASGAGVWDSVDNAGLFNVGNPSTNASTVAGDFNNTGSLRVEVDTVSDFDVLTVNGDASLGGVIEVVFAGFTPATGTTFKFLERDGALLDDSATFNFSGLDPGARTRTNLRQGQFTVFIPTPGALSLLGLGGLAAMRRRRG